MGCTAETPSPAPPSPSPAPPSPSPVPGRVCEDKDVHCPTSYEQYCQHESAQTREHIQNTCPLTCGLCTAETPSPAPPSPSPAPPSPSAAPPSPSPTPPSPSPVPG